MPKPLEMPGPGERAGFDGVLPESGSGPIPDGEMPGRVSGSPCPPECAPVREVSARPEGDGQNAIRRTSTDRDALPVVRLTGDMPERRLDHSADDFPRETLFDPAQDDTGPR